MTGTPNRIPQKRPPETNHFLVEVSKQKLAKQEKQNSDSYLSIKRGEASLPGNIQKQRIRNLIERIKSGKIEDFESLKDDYKQISDYTSALNTGDLLPIDNTLNKLFEGKVAILPEIEGSFLENLEKYRKLFIKYSENENSVISKKVTTKTVELEPIVNKMVIESPEIIPLTKDNLFLLEYKKQESPASIDFLTKKNTNNAELYLLKKAYLSQLETNNQTQSLLLGHKQTKSTPVIDFLTKKNSNELNLLKETYETLVAENKTSQTLAIEETRIYSPQEKLLNQIESGNIEFESFKEQYQLLKNSDLPAIDNAISKFFVDTFKRPVEFEGSFLENEEEYVEQFERYSGVKSKIDKLQSSKDFYTHMKVVKGLEYMLTEDSIENIKNKTETNVNSKLLTYLKSVPEQDTLREKYDTLEQLSNLESFNFKTHFDYRETFSKLSPLLIDSVKEEILEELKFDVKEVLGEYAGIDVTIFCISDTEYIDYFTTIRTLSMDFEDFKDLKENRSKSPNAAKYFIDEIKQFTGNNNLRQALGTYFKAKKILNKIEDDKYFETIVGSSEFNKDYNDLELDNDNIVLRKITTALNEKLAEFGENLENKLFDSTDINYSVAFNTIQTNLLEDDVKQYKGVTPVTPEASYTDVLKKLFKNTIDYEKGINFLKHKDKNLRYTTLESLFNNKKNENDVDDFLERFDDNASARELGIYNTVTRNSTCKNAMDIIKYYKNTKYGFDLIRGATNPKKMIGALLDGKIRKDYSEIEKNARNKENMFDLLTQKFPKNLGKISIHSTRKFLGEKKVRYLKIPN